MKNNNQVARLVVLIMALGISACATPHRPIYQWAGYQPSLYQYLKGNGIDPGANIEQLEAQIQKNTVAGEATPPGMHGHLALLYSKMGDDVSARRHLEAERNKFPESAAFIELLLKNAAAAVSKT